MKKIFVFLTLAGLALLACTKEAPVSDDAAQPLKFNLTVNHPGGIETKTVKTGWEDGDVVFVFFSEAPSPYYLKMTYESGAWTSTQMNRKNESSFPLSGGTMTAVFLPFGSDNTINNDAEGNTYFFDNMYYAYYLVAEKVHYTVSGGEVKGDLDMKLPEGFIQFYMAEEGASPSSSDHYSLWESHIAPAGVVSVGSDMSLNVNVRGNGMAMPAYYYDEGYIFSGILDEACRGKEVDYVLHLAVPLEEAWPTLSKKATLYTSETTDRAIKFDKYTSPWVVGDNYAWVDLGVSVKWSTVNMGASNPGGFGDYYAWGETETYYSSGAQTGAVWRTGKAGGYAWSSYSFTTDGGSTFTKYTGSDYTTLQPADDVASQKWKGTWRIPTLDEWKEIRATDLFTWTKDSNNGYTVTSHVPGYEGNSIYLPAAGLRLSYDADAAQTNRALFYWTSDTDNTGKAKSIVIGNGVVKIGSTDGDRCYGYSIRPVCD